MPLDKSIRIYQLAKEVKRDIETIMEDVRREGARVKVASNSVSHAIAEMVRNKYFPKIEASQKRDKGIIRKAKGENESTAKSEAAKLAKKKSDTNRPRSVKPPRIELYSKRKIKHDTNAFCDECRCEPAQWTYAETSMGIAHICAKCKPKIVARSSAKKDALDFAYQGGSFESKRRKH